MKTELAARSFANAEKLAFFRNHPIFSALGPELLERLILHARIQAIHHGVTIFSKGDAGTCVFAIIDGDLKVTSFSPQGKQAVFNVLSAGDIFGEIALLDGGSRTADVTAITDCRLIIIERRDFLPLVHSRPEIAQKLIEVLCHRLRRSSQQIEDLMFLELSTKLARVLLRLATKSGSSRIALTQSDIAQIVGASRESTNKQLRDWESRHWLALERGAVVLISQGELASIADDFDN